MASKYNRVAHEYEERRPGYRDELFTAQISQTGINRESALLEIGAGTGKGGNWRIPPFFHSVGERRFQGEKTIQNAEEFIKRFETTSAFASLDGQGGMGISRDQEKTINSMGGEVSSELVYILFTAERA